MLQDQLDDLAQRQAAGLLAHDIKFGDKGTKIGARLAAHRTHAVVKRTAGSPRAVLQLLYATCADAAWWKVDDAHEAGVVVRVVQQAQVSQRMLDFGALKKAQTAVHAVGHASIEQRGFHHPALGIAAVKQCDFLALTAVAHQLLDLVHKPLRLGKVAGRLINPHRLARTGIGAQVFAQPLAVVADQLVGRIQNIAKAAVIALKLDLVRDLKLPHEVGHIANARTTKGINTLVIVAHGDH